MFIIDKKATTSWILDCPLMDRACNSTMFMYSYKLNVDIKMLEIKIYVEYRGGERITFEFEKMDGTNVCVLGGFVMCAPGEDNGTLQTVFDWRIKLLSALS